MIETETTDDPDRPAHRAPALYFNWEDWLQYFEDVDAPLEVKREWIETLWAIHVSAVDLGFGLTATQQICGEVIDLKAVLEAAVVKSTGTQETDAKEAVE